MKWDKWNQVTMITVDSLSNEVEINSNSSKNQSIHLTWLMRCYFVKQPSANCQGKMILLCNFVTFHSFIHSWLISVGCFILVYKCMLFYAWNFQLACWHTCYRLNLLPEPQAILDFSKIYFMFHRKIIICRRHFSCLPINRIHTLC